MLLTLLFLLSGTVIQSTLDQEEYYALAYRVTESGEIEYDGELEPNPNYLQEGSIVKGLSMRSFWILHREGRSCSFVQSGWSVSGI